MTAAEALVNPDLLRDIAYRAKADRRVVASLLKGEIKQRPSAARARARAELIAVGVIFPARRLHVLLGNKEVGP